MHANADFASRLSPGRALLIQLCHGLLHLQCCPQSVAVLLRIGIRTSKNRQHSVADELVDGSIELENRIRGYRKILVEHFQNIFSVHPGGKIGKVPNVGKQERDLGSLAAQLQAASSRPFQEPGPHLGRKVCQQALQ